MQRRRKSLGDHRDSGGGRGGRRSGLGQLGAGGGSRVDHGDLGGGVLRDWLEEGGGGRLDRECGGRVLRRRPHHGAAVVERP